MDNRDRKEVNIDELDSLDLEDTPPTEPEKSQDIPGFDNEDGGEEDEKEKETPVTPDPEEDDGDEDDDVLEEKLTNVSREATALHFKNKKLTDTIEEVKNMPEPTIEELKAFAKTRGAEYDELDEFSQNILKDTLINKNKLSRIESVTEESKQIDIWAKKVDAFVEDAIDNSKYPSLSSHRKEFKRFVMKESRRGMDLDDAVASFLYQVKDTPKVRKNLLLSGGNGSAVPPKPAGLNENDVARIRENDPKEYRRLIKSGKINLEI